MALRDGDADELRRLESARSVSAGLARRARIVLLAAEGVAHTEVAELTGTSVPTVRHWRSRYASGGIAALTDAARPGRPRSVDEVEIVVRTLEPPPAKLGVTHWSSRLLAKELNVAPSTVVEVWRSYGLQPWRKESFKFSTDPQLETKIRDVVGLYLNPPENAIVLSVDEKSQCQALERSQPILPIRPGIPQQQTHDYIRHGTTTLFAALEVATGRIGADACYRRHRNTEFLAFLKKVAAAYPDTQLHIVCDNYRTHKHANVRAWLAEHPRVTLHFTPTGCSWLNMVEIFFGIITRQAIRRGSFTSVKQLTTAIGAFIDGWNDRCEPFSWTKDADEIIAKIKRKETFRARH
ncbi:IS630 family transposase [Actinomadura darangshiensis]|uniref:IS630 family transposase n=1 Tax=Actinomadura darangshiensis TaxID=705336 RepID=A0A4R4ZJI4_9ACTN|nr:IS630 family transposase [Actinomadura darangshiensis]